MKTWRTLIVDDEPLARMEIKKLLESYLHIKVVGEAYSVASAIKAIKLLQPNLLFLDIDLGTQSGFDLLEFSERNFQIIFVTAYDKYAIRAFEINALDYLLKPVHPDRLKKSITRLGYPFKNELKFKLEPFDRILVRSLGCSKLVSVSSITYIEAYGDYTRIFVVNRFKGLVHQTVKTWTERLPKSLFLKVHRCYIVNIQQIFKIQKRENGLQEIILKNNDFKIPVSRKYSSAIKTIFQ